MNQVALFIDTNFVKGRPGPITEITVHHAAAVTTLDAMHVLFANPARKASAHYGVKDGTVAQYVREEDTAWTNGNRSANERAITIEVVNDTGYPYWGISGFSEETLINLLVTIAIRHKLYPLVAGENLTEHRQYAKTECPGPYLHAKLPEIAAKVNDIIEGSIKLEGVAEFERYDATFWRVVLAPGMKPGVQVGAFMTQLLAKRLADNLNNMANKTMFIVEERKKNG